MKGEIKPKTIDRLKKYLPVLTEQAIKAGQLYKEIAVYCSTCSEVCCRGGFDRFTVFDHITDVVKEPKEYHRWGFRLRPVKPKKANIARMDENCAYLGSGGCILPYTERPVRCVYEDCGEIRRLITKDQMKVLSDIRREYNKVRFMYTIHLLFGGVKFIRHNGETNKQDVFLDNRRLRQPKNTLIR